MNPNFQVPGTRGRPFSAKKGPHAPYEQQLNRKHSDKGKRPMSASNQAKSSRNTGATTISGQNSRGVISYVASKHQTSFDFNKVDLARIRPTAVAREKEFLYEEALKLKMAANKYQGDNTRLKTAL